MRPIKLLPVSEVSVQPWKDKKPCTCSLRAAAYYIPRPKHAELDLFVASTWWLIAFRKPPPALRSPSPPHVSLFALVEASFPCAWLLIGWWGNRGGWPVQSSLHPFPQHFFVQSLAQSPLWDEKSSAVRQGWAGKEEKQQVLWPITETGNTSVVCLLEEVMRQEPWIKPKQINTHVRIYMHIYMCVSVPGYHERHRYGFLNTISQQSVIWIK